MELAYLFDVAACCHGQKQAQGHLRLRSRQSARSCYEASRIEFSFACQAQKQLIYSAVLLPLCCYALTNGDKVLLGMP